MKKIFTLIAAFALAGGAMAQTVKFSASLEKTKDGPIVNVNVENDVQINSVQFNYTLPEGTTVVTDAGDLIIDKGEKILATETSRKKATMDIRGTVYGSTMVTIYGAPNSMAVGDGTIAQIWVEGTLTGTAKFTNANAAYVDENKKVKAILADDFTLDLSGTAISTIKANANGAATYNIAGQRVNNAQKGILIQNGKKILK